MGIFDWLFGKKETPSEPKKDCCSTKEDNKTKNEDKKDNSDDLVLRVNWDETEDVGIVTHYKGEPFTGICFSLFDNGNVDNECEMKNGLKDGVSKYFNDNGDLIREWNYTNDKRNGICKWYHDNGKIKMEVGYNNESQEYQKEFDINGKESFFMDFTKKNKIQEETSIETHETEDDTDYKIVVKRQEELWNDTEEEEDYSGFTYILYWGEYNEESGDWEVDDMSDPIEEVISIIYNDKNKIIKHLKLGDDSNDYRWEVEYPTSQSYYGPGEIESMYNDDIKKFGKELKKICDLPKIITNY